MGENKYYVELLIKSVDVNYQTIVDHMWLSESGMLMPHIYKYPYTLSELDKKFNGKIVKEIPWQDDLYEIKKTGEIFSPESSLSDYWVNPMFKLEEAKTYDKRIQNKY